MKLKVLSRAAGMLAATWMAGPLTLGCSASSGGQEMAAASGGKDAAAPDGGVVGEDFNATPADFDCLKSSEWTTVGLSKFKNVLGHTAEALAVANSPDGGTYPVGTIVQLIPNEASVKRGKGYNAASHDWEFFSLSVSSAGTTITARGGGASVVNFTGSSCLNCHDKAAPQWDLVCGDADGGTMHGCAPLGITPAFIASVQGSDTRCR